MKYEPGDHLDAMIEIELERTSAVHDQRNADERVDGRVERRGTQGSAVKHVRAGVGSKQRQKSGRGLTLQAMECRGGA